MATRTWTEAPLDDLSQLPPDVRDAIEAAEERIDSGTARLVRQADVPVVLDEIREENRRRA
jgi:hypothetical protein